MDPKRHLCWIVPNPRRRPRRKSDWLRMGLVAVLVAAVVAGFWGGPALARRIGCNDGFPSGDIWSADGECVGLSNGSYAFGLEAFAPVLAIIDRQNQAAADHCDPRGTAVTVGVLLTMTDRYAGSRAVNELEGMAAGQLRANGTGCLHPVRLLLGQVGEYDRAAAAAEVARRLAAHPDVVAVAGVGLSHQLAADVADILAAAKIPMVSDIITAEGFDQSGSRDDRPVFDGCDPGITYPRGIGRDYFYRVAFRSSVQISALGAVARVRPDFIMVPTGGSDPYTCTTLPLMQRQFGGNVTEVKFDSEEASTVPQTARRVCGVAKNVTIAYIARGRDLGRFLYGLDEAFANGQCAASSITVLSTSDANRVRAAEGDPMLEDFRTQALRSASFTSGKVQLLATLVGGADKPSPANPGFATFERTFAAAGFDLAHIDDGWAVNAYDALSTISEALRTLPAGKDVVRSQVNTAISGFSSTGQAVPGAGGPITFDNSGNRAGPPPPVVRICPPPATSGGASARTTTVPLTPGGDGGRCL